jgi:hypothetical protein
MIQTPAKQQVVYQADPAAMQAVQGIQGRVHQLCGQLRNRMVRIEMRDGRVIEGAIVHADGDFLYIRVAHNAYPGRSLFNPIANAYTYNNVILPLVLYNLLAITLLYT